MASGAAPEPAAIPAREAIVLAEAFRLVDELGEEIWPGFSVVPFPVVLVTSETEFMIGWESSYPADFAPSFDHPVLGPVATRARVFSPELAAAFPAFGPPAVVVVGTMEATGRSPGAWALTLLHEHFHQLQYAAPDYHRDVEALDLAGGDETGMWMLDYPFPYAAETIGSRFAALAAELRRALAGDGDTEAPWSALRDLLAGLAPADARYLSFQLWQEGVARNLELRAAEAAAALEPEPSFGTLAGFDGWATEADRTRQRILAELDSLSLAEQGRIAFYPIGAALAMLLDRDAPGWRVHYLEHRFVLGPPESGGRPSR